MLAEVLKAVYGVNGHRERVFESLCIASLLRAQRPHPSNVPVNKGDASALRWGPHTRDVATCDGNPLAFVRRHLHRLVADGRVLCHPYAGGMSSWWPVGFADALEGAKTVEKGVTYYEFPPGFIRPASAASEVAP